MYHIGLRGRLFLSHIVVMMMGLATLLVVGQLYTSRLFMEHIQTLEYRGFLLYSIRGKLLTGFESAWGRGAFWSVIFGGSAAAALSYLLSKRIMQPLLQMQRITAKFAAGEMTARMPMSDIPELNRFAESFNRMALALDNVEQRRRELVSDLTHELRTPLTIVEGYLEGLADGTIDASPEIYQRLSGETQRLKRLVNDLQELSKAEAGYLPIDAKKFDLRSLLKKLYDRFSNQLIESKKHLILSIPNDIPRAYSDPERVEQILVNLLGNALCYTSEGSVTMRAEVKQGMLWVSVIDTGIGISEEDLPHIFERFWRSDRSRNRKSGGTGIGLAITKHLVELQQGIITVESILEQGSTFSFSIPIAQKTIIPEKRESN
ncbi:MAG: HAMP domain-containing sensor histidine kinase [Cyanobacteria bacterium]|nr:HAMP domain-containing sensor histidine kinase [Cyanobacteriota bacterium]